MLFTPIFYVAREHRYDRTGDAESTHVTQTKEQRMQKVEIQKKDMQRVHVLHRRKNKGCRRRRYVRTRDAEVLHSTQINEQGMQRVQI